MTTTRIALLVTTLSIATASSVAAQTRRPFDRLDPVDRTVELLARATLVQGYPATVPVTVPTPVPEPEPFGFATPVTTTSYGEYSRQYQQYLAEYARYQRQQQRESGAQRFANTLQGISSTMAVADQGLSLYEHYQDVKAYNAAIR